MLDDVVKIWDTHTKLESASLQQEFSSRRATFGNYLYLVERMVISKIERNGIHSTIEAIKLLCSLS
jgi:hypothetical protein